MSQILTKKGEEKLLKTKVEIAEFAVSDESIFTLDLEKNEIKKEESEILKFFENPKYKAKVSSISRKELEKLDGSTESVIEIKANIPKSSGGYVIQSICFFDNEGDVFSFSSYPSLSKPNPDSGQSIDIEIKALFSFTGSDKISLKYNDEDVLFLKSDFVKFMNTYNADKIARENERIARENREKMILCNRIGEMYFTLITTRNMPPYYIQFQNLVEIIVRLREEANWISKLGLRLGFKTRKEYQREAYEKWQRSYPILFAKTNYIDIVYINLMYPHYGDPDRFSNPVKRNRTVGLGLILYLSKWLNNHPSGHNSHYRDYIQPRVVSNTQGSTLSLQAWVVTDDIFKYHGKTPPTLKEINDFNSLSSMKDSQTSMNDILKYYTE